MKRVIGCVLTVLLHAPASAADPVRLIGHYSSMVVAGGADPHLVAGYYLHLYRQDRDVFGTLAIAVGAPEPVVVPLQAVTFDAATRRLRFEASYSAGWEVSARTGPAGRASRDRLVFAGTVAHAKVAGRFTGTDVDCQRCKSRVKRVVLKRTADTYVPASRVGLP